MIMLQHPNVFYGLSFLSCSRETSSRVSSYQVPREKSHLAEGYVYFIEGLVPEKKEEKKKRGADGKVGTIWGRALSTFGRKATPLEVFTIFSLILQNALA